MKRAAWNRFSGTREQYRAGIEQLSGRLPELQALQQRLVNNRSPSYKIETPVVYNSALDDISPASDIKLILVADNPGRREQAAENRRYLIGPSGKIAEKFFRDNPVLGIGFRENAIILNKTPIHTPRTIELKELSRLGGAGLKKVLDESQLMMARLLLEFHSALSRSGIILPVWITGYSEMGKNGVFETYANELKVIYRKTNLKENIFLFRHFSMNQFTIDLKKQTIPGETIPAALERIGTVYRKRFLW